MSLIRLDKFLANCGIGSRSEVRKYLRFKRVWVDGEPILNGDFKIDIEKNKVTFDKRVVSWGKYAYLMMNKPKGVISSTKDENEKTVIDLLDEKYKKYNLFPVGRLDKDTVGLLILSNDGNFAHNTLSPKKHISKAYYAHISGEVTEEHIEKFSKGINTKYGYRCMPAKLEILESSKELSKVKIEIKEGKFHQIKRMFETFSLKVEYLKRISFDEIKLDETLKEGEYRVLNEDEMKKIQKFI